MKKFLSVLLSICMLAGSAPFSGLTALAAEMSGSCGANATYSYDPVTQTLNITGTGELYNYATEDDIPIKDFASEVKTLNIDKDIQFTIASELDSEPYYLIHNCTAVETLSIPCSELKTDLFEFDMTGAYRDTNGIEPDLDPTVVRLPAIKSLKQLTIKSTETATAVPEYFFNNYENLETVILDGGITEIGVGAFANCPELKSFTVLNDSCSLQNVFEYTIYGDGGEETDIHVDAVASPTIRAHANSSAKDYAAEKEFTLVALCSDGTENHNFANGEQYCLNGCGAENPDYNSTVITGSCGENATYQYDRLTKTLDITGTGALYNYSTESERPFAAFASEVKTLNIGKEISVEAIDWIADKPYYALSGFTSVENLTIPCSVSIFEIDMTNAEVDSNKMDDDAYQLLPAIKSVKNLTLTGSEANSTVKSYLCNNYENLETVTLDGEVSAIGIGAFANCPELKSFTVLNDSCSLQNVIEYTIYGEGGPETNKHVYAVASPTVRAHANSLAKDYAEEKGLTFVALCTDGTENHSFSNSKRYCLNGCGAENPDYSAPYSGSCGENATYTFDPKTGTLTISGSGDMWSYSEGTAPWDAYKENIKTVNISDGITKIGNYAFNGCTGLKELTMPCSAEFDSTAFRECTNIESITLTKGTGEMCDYAVLSVGVTSYMFTPWCLSRENIKNLVIENGVTRIGNYAFYNCTGLTSITIPESVTNIGSSAFSGCSGLTSITIMNSDCEIVDAKTTIAEGAVINAALNSTGQEYADKYDRTFVHFCLDGTDNHNFEATNRYCLNGCGAENPGYINTCGEKAFYTFNSETGNLTISGKGKMSNYSEGAAPWYVYKEEIKTVNIEDGITNIGDCAFCGCTELKELTMPCSAVIYSSSKTFRDCTNIENITLTKGTGEMCNYVAGPIVPTSYMFTPWYINREHIKNLVIENGVTSIGNYAFYNCNGLTSITLPDSVTSIGTGAFEACTGLTIITIPDSVTTIGNQAFDGCTGLKSILIMNPDCEIYDSAQTIAEGVVIYSALNSTAQEYANKYSRTFMPLCSDGTENHDFDISTTATCGEDGEKTYTCKICGYSYSEPDSAHVQEHSFETKVIKAATWLENGVKAKVCSKCGAVDESSKETLYLSGSCGVYVYYSFNAETGVLTIYGKGDMSDYITEKSGSSSQLGKTTRAVAVGINPLTNRFLANSFVTNAFASSVNTVSPFRGNGNIKKVIVEQGVTSVGDYAFEDCDKLESITMAKSVSVLGSGSLKNSAVTELVVPEGMTTIKESACADCGKLVSVQFSNTLVTVADRAFENNTSLREVYASESIKNIGANSFDGTNSVYYVPKGSTFETYALGSGKKTVSSSISFKSGKGSYSYTGSAVYVNKNDLTVKVGNTVYTNFSIVYKNSADSRKNPNSYSFYVTVNNKKTNSISFNVVADIKNLNVNLNQSSFEYSGKAKKPKAKITLKDGKNVASYYKLSYSKNTNPGTASVIINSNGNKYYKGSKTVSFTIKPKKASIKKLKAKSKAFDAKWKKHPGIDYYELEYSTKRNFKGSKKLKVYGAGKTSVTVSKLSGKKRYHVRIRAVKKANGKVICGKWSSKKSVKTKK